MLKLSLWYQCPATAALLFDDDYWSLFAECEESLQRTVRHVTPADVTVTSHDVGVNSRLHCYEQSDCITAAEQLLRGNSCY